MIYTKKRNFVRVTYFNELYGLTNTLVYSKRSQGILPSYIFKKEGGFAYIDIKYFQDRQDFKHKLQSKCHAMYSQLKYYNIDDDIAVLSDYDFTHELVDMHGGSIQGWATFISQSLYATLNDSITITHVNKNLWKFYRTARRMIVEITKYNLNTIEKYSEFYDNKRKIRALNRRAK